MLCWCVDYAVYHLNEDWDYYKKYNHVREELLDYGMPSYEAHRETYSELGLSEHDYAMLTSWIFADRDVYSLETMEGLLEIIRPGRREPINYQKLKSIIVNFIDLSRNYIIFYVLFFLFFISTKINSPTIFLFTLASLLLGIGEVCYLIYSGRYPERAIMIPILGAITVIAYFIGVQNQTKSSAISETVLLSLVALYSYYAFGVANMTEMERPVRTEYNTVSSLFSELSDRQENLYVWDIFTSANTLLPAYGPFDDFEYGAHSNSVFMGGWLVPSPIMADQSEHFGEKNNIFKLLAENENVYFITMGEYQCELIRQFISEHYNPEVKYKLVDSINGYSIYSFAGP